MTSFLEKVLWYLKFGRPKHKISQYALRQKLDQLPYPVFFLSTGRAGTMWFTNLLKSTVNNIYTMHSESPDFGLNIQYLFDLSESNPEEHIRASSNLYLSGRIEHLRQSYKCEKHLIETNNHITFFAQGLKALFPQAKFVHLVRHPKKFIQSGLKRNWFLPENPINMKLITGKSNDIGSLTQVQKIERIWIETNNFIDDFSASHLNGHLPRYCIDNISIDQIKELYLHLGFNPPTDNKLKQQLAQKINTSKPSASKTDSIKIELNSESLKLMSHYGLD